MSGRGRNGGVAAGSITFSARRRNFVGLRLVPTAKSLAAAGNAHGCFPSPVRFTHVQLVLEGLSAATGIKAAVAASAAYGNGYTAKKADGSDNTFTPVTFGTTDPNDPSNPGGGNATASIAAGTGADGGGVVDIVNGRTFSDIIPLPSIDRTDGGLNWLVMARGYLNAANLPAGSLPSLNPANSGDPRGTIQSIEPDWAGGYQLSATDFIATPGSYAPTGFDWMFPAEIRAFVEQQMISVEIYDDSLGMGYKPPGYPVTANEGGGMNGPARRAIAILQALGLPFVLSNNAKVGQKSYAFLQNAANRIRQTRPSMALLKTWSPNDGSTQAVFDTAFAKLLLGVQTCQLVGTLPIPVIPPPTGNLSGAAADRLRAYVARCRNLGGYQFDQWSRMSDGANPERILPQYQPVSGFDGTHPGPAGDVSEGVALAATLRAAAGF